MLKTDEVINGMYRVLYEIGKGGTGVVYLAQHLNLEKYVVLKRLHTHTFDAASLRAETDILKNLHHPNLPQVYDFVIRDGDVFTVMDYIEGNPLSVYGNCANEIPEATLINWFTQLASVLDYIHTRPTPVLHSDIKPGNVILTPQGTAVLIDFNISLGSDERGKVVGYSRPFASPEQGALAQTILSGQTPSYSLDERTDIYSLGALFYYLVTGTKPDCFAETPRLTQMPGLYYTPAFLEVIDNCTRFDREKRYSSARKLLKALEGIKKKDSRYRMGLALKTVGFVLGGIVFAGGVYCMVKGARIHIHDEYDKTYEKLCEDVRSQDDKAVEEDIKQLENRFGFKMILKQPEEKAAVYHELGDYYYARKDYGEASEKYREALDAVCQTDKEKDVYYSDCALAYIENKHSTEAEDILTDAKEAGVKSGMIKVIEAGLAKGKGDIDQCMTLAEEVLEEESDPSILNTACRLIADTAYNAYMNPSSSESQKSYYIRTAVKYYSELCRLGDSTSADGILYGCALCYDEQFDKVISQMESLRKDGVKDYRIPMYKAIAHYNLGDFEFAQRECEEAMKEIGKLDNPYTEDENALSELKNKLSDTEVQ